MFPDSFTRGQCCLRCVLSAIASNSRFGARCRTRLQWQVPMPYSAPSRSRAAAVVGPLRRFLTWAALTWATLSRTAPRINEAARRVTCIAGQYRSAALLAARGSAKTRIRVYAAVRLHLKAPYPPQRLLGGIAPRKVRIERSAGA